MMTGTTDGHTYATLAFALRTSVIEHIPEHRAVFVGFSNRSVDSIDSLCNAVSRTTEQLATMWALDPEDARVTLYTQRARNRWEDGILTKMFSMAEALDLESQGAEGERLVQRAWNAAARMELESALRLLDEAVRWNQRQPSADVSEGIVDTGRHLASLLSVLLHDLVTFVAELLHEYEN